MNSWRNHQTQAEETRAVKDALKKAGLPFRKVGHGTGTAWGWLEIYAGQETNWETCQKITLVALEVTGRRGDYNGNISVLQQ